MEEMQLRVHVQPGPCSRLSALPGLGTQQQNSEGWHSARRPGLCQGAGLPAVLPGRLEEILNKYSVQEGECWASDLKEILVPGGRAYHMGLSEWDAGFWRCLLAVLFMFTFQYCGSSQELWTKCLLTQGLYKHRLEGWSCSGNLSLFDKLTFELILFYLNQASKIYSERLFFWLGACLSLSVLPLATFLPPLCTAAFLV